MSTILNLDHLHSVQEVAAAMRAATVCSTCRTNFATKDASDQLCDECREHFEEIAAEKIA
jgi:protein-arginine kinase activator protein McsA